MTRFEELVNDYTIMADHGAVIFSSYDRFLEFVEEIRADERKREREACAKVLMNWQFTTNLVITRLLQPEQSEQGVRND